MHTFVPQKAVFCLMEVLSHVHNPSEILKEIKRVLKKTGILLGSCPHENLQKYAWEDKRMIRQYYDLPQLNELLGESFEKRFIKVLNAAQFSFSMASSFLADQPAEMLFKCGRENMLDWDAALQDKSILRCWFGFTQGPGDVYYRMSGFADKMQKLGAQTHYEHYDDTDMNSTMAWWQKINYLPSENRFTNAHIVHELEALLKASDMSVFQITSSRSILLLLTTARLAVIKKPLYTEVDDWIFDLASYNSAAEAYRPNSEPESVALDQFKLSDGFICSTDYLKKKIEELAPGKPVYVIKNSLDFDIWDNVKINRSAHDANSDLIRIGYTGCGNHSGDMELIRKPIEALLDEFPNLEFISTPFPSLEGITNPRFKRFEHWVPLSQFPQVISDWEMDIGIAPLRDNEMNRAKSNLRWLEYSALKIPTIASQVEPFEKSITDKKDGLLVSNSAKNWYEKMRELIVDKDKRIKIGQAAYANVKKNYDMEKTAKTYLSILKEIKNEFIKSPSRNRQVA